MRYLFGFICVCALAGALPLSASAQAGEEGASVEPSAEEPAQSSQWTQSRLERWHPEAFVDPTKPASEPALQLELDSAGLEVTPTALPTVEELELRKTELRKRRRAIGIGVSVIVVAVGVAVGVGVAVSFRNWEL